MPFDQIDAIIVKHESGKTLAHDEFLALSAHLGDIPTDVELAAEAARLAEEEEDFSDLLELCQ